MCPDSKIGGVQGAFGSPRGLPARTIGSKICIEFHYLIFNEKVFFEKMYKKIFLKKYKHYFKKLFVCEIWKFTISVHFSKTKQKNSKCKNALTLQLNYFYYIFNFICLRNLKVHNFSPHFQNQTKTLKVKKKLN